MSYYEYLQQRAHNESEKRRNIERAQARLRKQSQRVLSVISASELAEYDEVCELQEQITRYAIAH